MINDNYCVGWEGGASRTELRAREVSELTLPFITRRFAPHPPLTYILTSLPLATFQGFEQGQGIEQERADG